MLADVERVIIWDGTGQERVGTLVHPSPALSSEEDNGRIITLPTDERMFGKSALGGLFIRHWGGGVKFTSMQPQRHCPMVLHVVADLSFLHWVLRIEKVDKDAGLRGTLAIVGTNDPVIPMVGVLSAVGRPVDLQSLGEPDKQNGWFIKGKSVLRTMQDGLCPLMVQAVSDNLRVRWTALTQSRSEE
jgi:hypothetical protein